MNLDLEVDDPNGDAELLMLGWGSSYGPIGEACRRATGSRPFAFVHSDNGSLTRIVVHADGHWTLRTFNDVAHLYDVEAPEG